MAERRRKETMSLNEKSYLSSRDRAACLFHSCSDGWMVVWSGWTAILRMVDNSCGACFRLLVRLVGGKRVEQRRKRNVEIRVMERKEHHNATGETLFEAVRYTAVDWGGQTCSCAIGSSCDLSHVVVADDGIFSSRDAVFDRYGLLLHQPAGCLFELVFGGRKAA